MLELGAGCGAVGLSLAAEGHELTLTDQPHLLPLLHFNAMRNAANGRPASVAPLQWGNAGHLSALVAGLRARDFGESVSAWDLILASDVAYDEEQHANLLQSLAFLAHQRRPAANKVAAQLHTGGQGVRLQLGVLGPAGCCAGGSPASLECSTTGPPARILLALPDRGDEIARLAHRAEQGGWTLYPREVPAALCPQNDEISHRVIVLDCVPPTVR